MVFGVFKQLKIQIEDEEDAVMSSPSPSGIQTFRTHYYLRH
jgi:hypothetical protein